MWLVGRAVRWRPAKPSTQVRILYRPQYQYGDRSLMVGRKFVALYVRVRFSPVTPKTNCVIYKINKYGIQTALRW